MSPRSRTAKKPRTLAVILKDAWKLRDELDQAAIRVSGAHVRRSPKGVRKALEEATAALYFRESHKYEAKFQAIIRALAPDVSRILDERGPADAYTAAHGEDEP